MKKKRIINFVSGMDTGGVPTLMYEWYKNLGDDVQFDIATAGGGIMADKVEHLGCKVIPMKPFREIGLIGYINQCHSIILTGKYDVVHSHIATASMFVFIAAIKANVKCRILHSHGTKYEIASAHLCKKLVYSITKLISNVLATDYLTCSMDAAKALFTRQNVKKSVLIPNGIDMDRFYLNPIEHSNKIIGYPAAYISSKNHMFLLEVIKIINESNSNIILQLIGSGDCSSLIEFVWLNKLSDIVVFCEPRSDMEKFYNSIDMLVFPSLNEGLGIIAIEAQACGLKTVLSPYIPREVECTSLACRLELKPKLWADYILNNINYDKKDVRANIISYGFDTVSSAKKLKNIYMECSNENRKSI